MLKSISHIWESQARQLWFLRPFQFDPRRLSFASTLLVAIKRLRRTITNWGDVATADHRTRTAATG
jgi:hypothetical protein